MSAWESPGPILSRDMSDLTEIAGQLVRHVASADENQGVALHGVRLCSVPLASVFLVAGLGHPPGR